MRHHEIAGSGREDLRRDAVVWLLLANRERRRVGDVGTTLDLTSQFRIEVAVGETAHGAPLPLDWNATPATAPLTLYPLELAGSRNVPGTRLFCL